MLPHLTEIMDTLWRDFEVAGCHHPSRPFTSPNTSEDCQKISVYFEHHAKGPEGNIILRSPYHYPPDASLPGFVRVPLGWEDLCEPCAEFGEVWEPIDPGDVTVATIVFANIGWGVGCDIAGVLPLLLAFRNTRRGTMKQLKLSHSAIRGEASLHALGVVLALKPISDLSLERVYWKMDKAVQLLSGWGTLRRLEITGTPAGLMLLDSLWRSGSQLEYLLYQVHTKKEVWDGELRRVLQGFNLLQRADIQVQWRLIDPTDVGIPKLASGEYLLSMALKEFSHYRALTEAVIHTYRNNRLAFFYGRTCPQSVGDASTANRPSQTLQRLFFVNRRTTSGSYAGMAGDHFHPSN